jgi:hypothetical protein
VATLVEEVVPFSSSSIVRHIDITKIGATKPKSQDKPDISSVSHLVRKKKNDTVSETSIVKALSSNSNLTTVVSTVNSLMESQAQAQSATNQMFLAMMATLKELSNKVDAMGDRGGGGPPSST